MRPSASPGRRRPATLPGLLLLLAFQLLPPPPLLAPTAAAAAPAALPIAAAAAPRPSNSSSSSSRRRTGPPLPSTPASNSSGGAAQLNPVSALLRDLPALKAAVIGACAASAGLVACLLFRVLRSSKKMKKTRKYDIITTPAERVEMAPLNEDEDDEEDSTVFDIKYR